MYPPFFIFGAFLSGFATVLLLIMPMRRLLRLERYITGRHVDVLGRLLLTSSLFVGYAYIMDGFNTYYGGEKAEITMYQERLFGYYAAIYWAAVLFNVLLPQLLWFAAIRLNQIVVALISIGVIIGMWCERYTIVVVSLHRPRLPSSYGIYHGSIWDWLTLMGTVGFFIFGILLIVRAGPGHFNVRDARNPRAEAAMKTVVASFATKGGLIDALPRLRGLGEVETYTPEAAGGRRDLDHSAGGADGRLDRRGRRLRDAGLCQRHRLPGRYRRAPEILLARLRSDRVRDRRPGGGARRLRGLPGRQPFAAAVRPGRRVGADARRQPRPLVRCNPHRIARPGAGIAAGRCRPTRSEELAP